MNNVQGMTQISKDTSKRNGKPDNPLSLEKLILVKTFPL